MSEFHDQLSEIDGWEGVSEEDVEIADGTYVLQVQNCQLQRAKTGQQSLMVVVSWVIIDNGEYDGETFPTRYFPQDVPRGARLTKQLIRALGFEPPVTNTDLETMVDTIHNAAPQVQAAITSKTNDQGYLNYWLNIKTIKLLGAGERLDREPKREKTDGKKSRAVGETTEDVVQVTTGAVVSFKDNDGDVHEGTVVGFKGDKALIREAGDGDDVDPWDVPPRKLTVVTPAAEGDGEPEPEADDLDELDRAGLKAIIKEEGLEVTVYKGWDEDKIRGAIRDARPEPEAPEPEEPVEPGTEGEPEDPEPEGDKISLDDLIAIGQGNGINIADKDDADTVMKKLTSHKWNKQKLTEDEIDKLTGIGCKFATPAPKPKARTVAKPKGRTVTRTVARKKGGKKKARR